MEHLLFRDLLGMAGDCPRIDDEAYLADCITRKVMSGEFVPKDCEIRSGIGVLRVESGKWKFEPHLKTGPKPGDELEKILSAWGFRKIPGCQCDAIKTSMNNSGPDWCESHVEIIVDWLRDEAVRRFLPFSKTIARVFIKRAIRESRKNP